MVIFFVLMEGAFVYLNSIPFSAIVLLSYEDRLVSSELYLHDIAVSITSE